MLFRFHMKRLATIGLFTAAIALIAGINQATAAEQCTTTTNSTANAALSIGTSGALLASQTLNGILYTEGQIGVMADRILETEVQIGAMANRIVYVTQISQTNSVVAIYLITNLAYLGKIDNQYKYTGTVIPVASKPAGW